MWKNAGDAMAAFQPALMKQMAEGMSGMGGSPAMPFSSMPFPWPGFGAHDKNMKAATGAFEKAMETWKALPLKFAGAAAEPKSEDEAKRSGEAGQAAVDHVTMELLKKILDPREWMSATGFLDSTVQQLAEGPKFADIGQVESKFAAVAKAWNEVLAASANHRTHVLKAWTKAIREFLRKLNQAAIKAQPLVSRREIVGLWVEIANKHLLEVQSSEPYLESQRILLKASLKWRMAQQELADFYAEMMGLPTRPDFDDLARMVSDLRREVRAAKRARSASASADKVMS